MKTTRRDISASLKRTGSLSLGRFIKAVCFVGVLLVLGLTFLTSQLFVLGVLDRLGFAPQFAILLFNITAVLVLGGRRLSPVVNTFNRLREAIGATVNAFNWLREAIGRTVKTSRLQTVIPESPGRPNLICKTLIIRRLSVTVPQPSADAGDERRTTNELVAADGFSGS